LVVCPGFASGARAAREPSFDDLPGQTGDPDHSLGAARGRSAERALFTATSAGIGVGSGVEIARAFVRAGLLAASRQVTGAVGLGAMGLGGLLVGAAMQQATQGHVDWAPLLASTAGSMIAILALNPATLPATIAIAALGGLAGHILWQASQERMLDPKKRS
jgi:hypothetical protein